MHQTRPTVSVVITAYDRPDFLATAISSALAQSHPPHQVFVIDDCSPTNLLPAIAAFGDAIIYERLAENRGANHARNRGIALATGEFVAFLDDDDLWEPDKIEKQIAAMRPGDEACLCGFGFDDRPKINFQPIQAVTEDILRLGNLICGTTGLIAQRSTLLEEPFDEDLPNAQDWDIYVRLARRRPIAYVPAPLFKRRYGSHDSITLAQVNDTPLDLERRASAIKKHRAWLGEHHYRRLLAANFLKYISHRRSKLKFIVYAIKRAGLAATLRTLCRRVNNRLNR